MKSKLLGLVSVGLLATPMAVSAVTVDWTDWTGVTSTSTAPGAASGTMAGVTVSVSSTAALNGLSQTGGPCTNYWTENASDPAYTGGTVSNAPTACEQVGLNTNNTVTVTFSSAVTGLYMALLSVGQPGLAATYDFDRSFVIDSEGGGYWGNDITDGVIGAGDTLTMREFHGLLLFSGPVSSLTFSTFPTENWHAFTFGLAPASVPEPGTLALLGLGLAGLGLSHRRKAA
jgi:hypothetical protein